MAEENMPTSPQPSKRGRPKGEPHVKATYYLPVKLKRLVKSLASDLGMDASQLVTKLLSQGVRGTARPTIPKPLRLQLGQDIEEAA